MKREFRRRILSGGMIAYVLLFALVISVLSFFSYLQLERDSTGFLDSMLQTTPCEIPVFPSPTIFGFQAETRPFRYGFYDLYTDSDGEILSLERRGLFEEDDSFIADYVASILASGKTGGKIGAWRYGMHLEEDGSAHILLLDHAIQLQTLQDTLKNMLLAGLFLLLLLFLILLPVSAKVADRLIQSAENQKQFMTNAGHDLKTPLSILRANLETQELLEGKTNWTVNMTGQLDRLDRLIHDLLLFSRLDEKQLTDHMETLNLSTLLDMVLSEDRPRLEMKEIAITTAWERDLYIRGDAESVKELLHSLLDNAVLYTPTHGTLIIQARRNRRKIQLVICNSVADLPAKNPERLLERFVRGDEARTQKCGGSGIGLSAAQTVVRMHHGLIRIVYPDQNHFSVEVELPACSRL